MTLKAILRGIATIMTWGNYPQIRQPKNDYDAIKSDWETLGDDMKMVIKGSMAQDILDSLDKKTNRFIKRQQKKGKL